jgi:ASC-1-like (ASCH) protein
MSIQEIAVPNNQKKRILKSIDGENIIFKDDNGDVVVNVEAYIDFKEDSGTSPIEELLSDETIDFDKQYIVFS